MLRARRAFGSVIAGSVLPWYRSGGAPLPTAVYKPRGAVSLAASYINLANPGTNDAATGTAPGFATATGWKFNGTTQRLLTGIIPSAGGSMIVFYGANAVSGVKILAGATGDVANTTRFWISPDGDGIYYSSGASSTAQAGRQVDGVVAIAGQSGFRGGGYRDLNNIGAWSGAIDDAIVIGALNNNGTIGNFSPAYIHAVLIWKDQTLTDDQGKAIIRAGIKEMYTTWIVFDGDSLTHGAFDTASNYPGRLISKLTGAYSTVSGVSFGIPSQKMATMLANVNTKIVPQIQTVTNNILCAWGGTNDLWSTADSAATIHGYIQSYFQAAAGYGTKVAFTITPTTSASAPADFETRRAALNTLIRNNYAGYADLLVDLAADARLSNPDDTTYFHTDKLHLNNAGYDVVADLVKAQLEPA